MSSTQGRLTRNYLGLASLGVELRTHLAASENCAWIRTYKCAYTNVFLTPLALRPSLHTGGVFCLASTPAVIDASLDKTRACFEGHLGEDPRPFDFGDGGPGQLVVPEEEEEVGSVSRA